MSEPLQAAAELPAAIVSQSNALFDRAKSIVIVTDADYATAADFVNDLRATEKRLDEDRVRLKAPFLAGTRQIDEYFRAPLLACKEAVAAVKRTMVAYDDRKRAEREEAERKAEAERRRIQQEQMERERREQEAREATERARLAEETKRREAAEAQARHEREAREAAEAAARGDREAAEAANKRAKEAEEAADRAKAQAAADREAAIEARRRQLAAERASEAGKSATDEAMASIANVAAAAAGPVKVSGVARKTVWKYRIKPNGIIPATYLIPDEAKIQAAVDRLKDMAQETLGGWIEVYSESELAVGKARRT